MSTSATESVEPLARQALDLAKNALLVNLRFMNTALARLAPFPVRNATLATDGAHVRYDPATLARMYANDPNELTRACLHIVLHNVFLHLYADVNIDALRWDTACDIVVERTINELDLPVTRTARATRQSTVLARIDLALPLATAETVYRYLKDEGCSNTELEQMRAPFVVDDHEPWHRMMAEEAQQTQDEEKQRNKRQSAPGAPTTAPGKSGTDMEFPDDANDKTTASHASHQGMDPNDIVQKDAPEEAHWAQGGRFANTVNLDRFRDQWENAAYEMGVQLDTYVKLWGVKGSNLAMNLQAVTREKQDFQEFLRKFARREEQIHINDEEFDYVYYCYGLEHYGNLPLIEPLEYAEEKRIRDFVIAIDTSASTKDDLVRRFVEKAYSVLSDETSFFADMNVLIVQCDAAITDVARIANMRDLEEYLDHLEIKGLGGTDFRPVFSYVEDAIAQGDLTDLGGLLYFTDGQGTYPKHKPDFDTAFVFVDSATAAASPTIPPWAMKVVLEGTDIVEEDW